MRQYFYSSTSSDRLDAEENCLYGPYLPLEDAHPSSTSTLERYGYFFIRAGIQYFLQCTDSDEATIHPAFGDLQDLFTGLPDVEHAAVILFMERNIEEIEEIAISSCEPEEWKKVPRFLECSMHRTWKRFLRPESDPQDKIDWVFTGRSA